MKAINHDREGGLARSNESSSSPASQLVLPVPASPPWLLVIGFMVVAACPFLLAGYRIDAFAVGSQLAIYLAAMAMCCIALNLSSASRLGWAMTGITLSAAIATGGMMLTYAAAALDMPFVDAKLLRFDRAIGYHWIDYSVFVFNHPYVAKLLRTSYMLIYVIPVTVIYGLAYSGRFERINRYLVATMVSLIITAMIFALCPALTAWDYLGVGSNVVKKLKWLPDATFGWERNLLEIRAGRSFVLDDFTASGLIAFPSYHCIAGLLFVWALWPLRPLRIPVIIVSSLLIAATPIFGGHYIADLIGGVVVTIISIGVTHRLERLPSWRRSMQS